MTRQTRFVLVLFILFAAFGVYLLAIPGLTPTVAMAAPTISASQRYVNGATGTDTGNCTNTAGNPICKTISYAISVALVSLSPTISDTINIYPGTYSIAPTLVITKYIILQGTSSNAAQVVLDGGGSNTVLHAEASQLTINNLTIKNGNAGSGVGGGLFMTNSAQVFIRNSFITNNQASQGAGIFTGNNGSLTLIRSSLNNNSATGDGGGIMGGVGTSMLITTSAVVSNTAANGGGIVNQGSLTAVNSTISDNSAAGGNGGGINTAGSVNLEDVTLYNNQAGSGGGIYSSGGTATLRNTILAGNTSSSGSPDCTGTLTFSGYNLLGTGNSCGTLGPTDKTTASVLLGSLALNGGYTLNHMPQPTSPAINMGSCTDASGHAVLVDQRNTPRPQPRGGACDIGAVEAGNAPALLSINPTSAIGGSGAFSMTLTGLNFSGANASGQNGATVLWIAGGVTTTLTPSPSSISSTEIKVTIPASLLLFPGTVNVAVQNYPYIASNQSETRLFTISPNPSLRYLFLPVIFK